MPKLKLKLLEESTDGNHRYLCKECKEEVRDRDLNRHAKKHFANTVQIDTTVNKNT